jgi:hypothetical protein
MYTLIVFLPSFSAFWVLISHPFPTTHPPISPHSQCQPLHATLHRSSSLKIWDASWLWLPQWIFTLTATIVCVPSAWWERTVWEFYSTITVTRLQVWFAENSNCRVMRDWFAENSNYRFMRDGNGIIGNVWSLITVLRFHALFKVCLLRV